MVQDYYPAGAYDDPNAPYNQRDYEEEYCEDAAKRIQEEVDGFECWFEEFVCEKLDGAPEDTQECMAWYRNQDADVRKRVEDEYYEHRKDDVIQQLIDEEAGKKDYWEEMRAEEARERDW